jgi:hypothetical protein
MSETRQARREERAKRRMSESGGASEAQDARAAPAPAHSFAVVASGENVVMVNTTTGQTWAMATDGSGPVWHPVEFSGGASRAPRRGRGKKKAEDASE